MMQMSFNVQGTPAQHLNNGNNAGNDQNSSTSPKNGSHNSQSVVSSNSKIKLGKNISIPVYFLDDTITVYQVPVSHISTIHHSCITYTAILLCL